MNKLITKLKSCYHFCISLAAYWFYGRPSRRLIVAGVTGTKGKSSTCRFIAEVLSAGGYKVGLLSTVEFQVAEKRWLNDQKMTMLGRGQIHKMLRDMVRAGCAYAVVETSSEGIAQYRHLGLNYDIAVFTNLGTEHQERHGGFENLRAAKGELFAAVTKKCPKVIKGNKIPSVIVINADDAEAEFYLQFVADEKWTYALKKTAGLAGFTGARHLQATNIQTKENETEFIIAGNKYHLNIPGEFNVYNAVAAAAVGMSQHIEANKISIGLSNVKEIPGRMEFIDAGQPFKVIVDYAHEPISYTALFKTLRNLVAQSGGQVIALIGSDGGGRDVSKRGRMGEIAGNLCDYVVVSDVNCFDEDPLKIAEMLAAGARQAGKQDQLNLFVEVDRRQGFQKALALAKPGDAVVFTAKGTEPHIASAQGRKIPWDDRAVAREILRAMGYKKHS